LYNFRLLDMTVPQDWLKWAQRIDVGTCKCKDRKLGGGCRGRGELI
jgi:hypothetical protein